MLLLQDRPLPPFQKLASDDLLKADTVHKPIFSVSPEDSENSIFAVFFARLSDKEIEVSVVFKDEDHPNWVIDELYDFYRWNFAWKRQADVESFQIQFQRAGGRPSSVSFPTTFAGEQRYDEPWIKHFSAEIPYDEFHREGTRPVIYVNTWNHLYSNKAGLETGNGTMIRDYPSYQGTRRDVEKLFRRHRDS